MDLRIQPNNPAVAQADKSYLQQRSTPASSDVATTDTFLKTLQEKSGQEANQISRESVLSLPELATLHVLFGSEKPDESAFYGSNHTSQIYKGHLLDVAG